MVRTYSNSLETTLIIVGIALLGPELFGPTMAQKMKMKKTNKMRIRPLASLAFIFGGMSVAIRFTAVTAWIPIGLIICLRQASIGQSNMILWKLYIVYGFLGVLVGCVIDWHFYGFPAIPFLGSFHFNVLLGE